MRNALEGKQYVENYVQTLTHEIKSPLSAISGAAELLKENMTEEYRGRFLDNIRSESKRIQAIVDKLLQLSALENRKGLQDQEEIDLSQLLEDLKESLLPLTQKKEITLELSGEDCPSFHGEYFLVRQAAANLIQNAIDFSPQGSTICVAGRKKDQFLELSVTDQGPGIPDYAEPYIFNRFYSLKRPDTGQKSSGLGLSFVKEVAAIHGGAVRLENNPGGGAKAVLSFPV